MKRQEAVELAKRAAIKAGQYLKEVHNEPLKVDDDGGRDVKLQADKKAEKIIIKILKGGSQYGLLAEESGQQNFRTSDDPMWIVDPLDGTLNFSRGISLYCVSIALWHGDHPILGVVYDFNNGELFSGIVGIGAWCNESPISVSKEECKNRAILATGFPVNRDFASSSLQQFLSNIRDFKKIRLFGSAALSLAYVACGRVDAYTEEDIMFWDVAAGLSLVMASGGWFESKKSGRNEWTRHVRCAGNIRLFSE